MPTRATLSAHGWGCKSWIPASLVQYDRYSNSHNQTSSVRKKALLFNKTSGIHRFFLHADQQKWTVIKMHMCSLTTLLIWLSISRTIRKQRKRKVKLDRQLQHTETNSKDAQKHLWSSGQSCSFSGDKHLSSSERNWAAGEFMPT